MRLRAVGTQYNEMGHMHIRNHALTSARPLIQKDRTRKKQQQIGCPYTQSYWDGSRWRFDDGRDWRGTEGSWWGTDSGWALVFSGLAKNKQQRRADKGVPCPASGWCKSVLLSSSEGVRLSLLRRYGR